MKSKNKKNWSEFIHESNKIHNNVYKYPKQQYKNNNIKIEITCPEHGTFKQSMSNHLNGHGCMRCGYIKNGNLSRYSDDKIISMANTTHYNLYTYPNLNYSGIHKLINIKCEMHGEFSQIANDHINGAGCPACNNSRGEMKIRNFLTNNSLSFKHNKTFDNCRNPKTNYKLKFDFYIPTKNIQIEFDGTQHFVSSVYFGRDDGLQKIQYRDNIKNEYAKNNNIKLLRIPYTKIKEIDKILTDELL